MELFIVFLSFSHQELPSRLIEGFAWSLRSYRKLTIWWRKLTNMLFGRFWGLFNASVTYIWFKRCFHTIVGTWRSIHVIFHLVKNHLAPYLGPFGAYLEPQWPLYGSKCVSIYQLLERDSQLTYLPSGQKAISFGQKQPQQTIWLSKLTS